MSFGESRDDRATLSTLRTSIARLAASIDAQRIDREGAIPASVIAQAKDMGLFALTIPAAYGGVGLSMRAACELVAELACHDRSVAVMVGLHNGLGTHGLVAFGSEAQKARWLPQLATGERIASFAATEPGAGSDLMAVVTTGRRVDGGFLVTGTKSYVTNGGFAGLYTVLVRTPDVGGAFSQSLCCIEAGTPGFTVGAEEDKLGIRGSSTVTLHFDSVFVPDDHVLGEPGRGTDYCNHVLAWGRTLMSAGCIGIARAALRATLAHVELRSQFGKRLRDFSLVREQCADMAARAHAMEAIVAATCECEASLRELERRSTLAKVFCSENAFLLSDRAIQLHGALGFLEPTGVARLLRDCRITRIFEGANDVLLVRTGAALLAARDAATDLDACAIEAPPLRAVTRELEQAFADFDTARRAVRAQYGLAVVGQQRVLWHVARAYLLLVAARASLALLAPGVEAGELAVAEHAAALLMQDARAELDALDPERDPELDARVARVSAALFSQTPARVRSKDAAREELVR